MTIAPEQPIQATDFQEQSGGVSEAGRVPKGDAEGKLHYSWISQNKQDGFAFLSIIGDTTINVIKPVLSKVSEYVIEFEGDIVSNFVGSVGQILTISDSELSDFSSPDSESSGSFSSGQYGTAISTPTNTGLTLTVPADGEYIIRAKAGCYNISSTIYAYRNGSLITGAQVSFNNGWSTGSERDLGRYDLESGDVIDLYYTKSDDTQMVASELKIFLDDYEATPVVTEVTGVELNGGNTRVTVADSIDDAFNDRASAQYNIYDGRLKFEGAVYEDNMYKTNLVASDTIQETFANTSGSAGSFSDGTAFSFRPRFGGSLTIKFGATVGDFNGDLRIIVKVDGSTTLEHYLNSGSTTYDHDVTVNAGGLVEVGVRNIDNDFTVSASFYDIEICYDKAQVINEEIEKIVT